MALAPISSCRPSSKASSVIHPDDALRVAKTIVESAQQLTLWRQEYRVCLPGRGEAGTRCGPAPATGERGRALAWLSEHRAEKHQAMELEEAQRMLQHLLHAMPVALCMVDESRHLLRNQRFLKLSLHRKPRCPAWMSGPFSPTPIPPTAARSATNQRRALAHAATHDGYIPSQEYRITAAGGSVLTIAIGGVQFGSSLLVTFVDRTAEQSAAKHWRKWPLLMP